MNKADQLARAFEIASLLARRNQIEVSRDELDLLRRKAQAWDGVLNLAMESPVHRIEICADVDEAGLWEIQILGRYREATSFTAYDPLEAIEAAMSQQPPRDAEREGKTE